MAWTLEYDPDALRELNKLDRTVRERIVKFLQERLAPLDNPRPLGKRLHGEWSDFWRFRVGDYRVIATLEQQRLIIAVVRVAHRSEAYDR